MNLRDLQYASTLAATLHFGEAAKRCHVSQSTLSIQIKKLEEELGASLFERDARSVRLSEAGMALLPQIKRLLGDALELQKQAAGLRDPLSGTVRLGAFPTLAPYILPHVMPHITQALPQLRIELVEEKTETLLTQLLEGTLDAALIALPVHHPRLDAIPLFAEPFLLAAPPTHPLAKHKQITLDALQNETLLLLDEGHCLRAQSLEFCTRIGSGESQSYRATSLETLRHMVASGAGLTLMPALAAEAGDHVAYLPFHDHAPERQIALVIRSATARRLLFTRMAGEIRTALKGNKSVKPLASRDGIRQN